MSVAPCSLPPLLHSRIVHTSHLEAPLASYNFSCDMYRVQGHQNQRTCTSTLAHLNHSTGAKNIVHYSGCHQPKQNNTAHENEVEQAPKQHVEAPAQQEMYRGGTCQVHSMTQHQALLRRYCPAC